jgi:hypothetical protein
VVHLLRTSRTADYAIWAVRVSGIAPGRRSGRRSGRVEGRQQRPIRVTLAPGLINSTAQPVSLLDPVARGRGVPRRTQPLALRERGDPLVSLERDTMLVRWSIAGGAKFRTQC